MGGPSRERQRSHYVFHDWQYQFTFNNVEDVKATMGTVLGSMTPETSCVCHFSWHYPGTPHFLKHLTAEEVEQRVEDLERGLQAVRLKQSDDIERAKGWYSH